MLRLSEGGGAVEERAGYGRRAVTGARAKLVLVAAPVDSIHVSKVTKRINHYR